MLVQYVNLNTGKFYSSKNSIDDIESDDILTHQFDAPPFRVLKINLRHTSTYVKSLIAECYDKTCQIDFNVANSSGVQRDMDEIRLKSLCGLISEKLLLDILTKYNHHPDAIKISGGNFTTMGEQIDLLLSKQWHDHMGRLQCLEQSVEVRSSFPHKPIASVIAKDFDVLGAYTNTIKKHEPDKDWYVRFLYQLVRCPEHRVYKESLGSQVLDYNATNTKDLSAYFDQDMMLVKDLVVYLVGGATGAMMSDPSIAYMGKMHSTTFNQAKQAHYRKIKLHNALDALSLIHAMLAVITEEAQIQK